ncbi:MAG: sigma-70 family RNA polymerase sigma factor [Bacilli bacterium]|nr:sigma-70 family RNA polymerase sigma factor [Bacilli bacterium]
MIYIKSIYEDSYEQLDRNNSIYKTTYYQNLPDTLSNKETNRLIKLYKEETDVDKKRAIKEQIIVGNMKFAVYVTFSIYIPNNSIVEFSDLVQTGYEALGYCIDNYSLDRGVPFTHYAYNALKRRMLKQIKELSPYPEHIYDEITRMKRMDNMLNSELGYTPADKDLAKALSISEERLKKLKEYYWINNMEEYNDNLVVSDSVESEVFRQQLKKEVEKMFDVLNDREKELLILRYGLKDGQFRTLQEVAQIFDLTKTRIRQLELRSLEKLKNSVKKQNEKGSIYDFLNMESKEINLAKEDKYNDEQNIKIR